MAHIITPDVVRATPRGMPYTMFAAEIINALQKAVPEDANRGPHYYELIDGLVSGRWQYALRSAYLEVKARMKQQRRKHDD
jgi:hypothetical protein